MPKYDLSKKIINRDISRRDMIKGLGAAGVITTTAIAYEKSFGWKN